MDPQPGVVGGSASKRMTKLVSHPTLCLAFSGHADQNIRFWDTRLVGPPAALSASHMYGWMLRAGA